MEKLAGQLLVATPAIDMGPFHRAVVLILDHDRDGALGVVINQPLDSGVAEVLPQWADCVNDPGCLFAGGPVAKDSALAVGVLRGDDIPSGWRRMSGRVGLVDLDGPVGVMAELSGMRVFAGYAGWSPHQLEDELEEGSWMVVPARDDDVMSATPETLWRRVLKRQPGELRVWASYPDDPGLN